MIEILILFAFLFIIASIYIYFSVKSKNLSIKILNEVESKQLLESFIQNTKQELETNKNDFAQLKEQLIKTTQQLDTEHTFLVQLQEANRILVQEKHSLQERYTVLQSTVKANLEEAVKLARADSVKRQRSILKGQATEQLAPYINPNYNPKDYKFLGDPIDYVIFDGMSDINSKTDKINKIILMDIKTGTSRLNRVQKAVRDCIESGNLEFQVYRPEKDIDLQQEEDSQHE